MRFYDESEFTCDSIDDDYPAVVVAVLPATRKPLPAGVQMTPLGMAARSVQAALDAYLAVCRRDGTLDERQAALDEWTAADVRFRKAMDGQP